MINRKNLLMVLLIYGIAALLFMIVAPARAERLYDETGKYQGRVQDNGRIYDETGKYQGRIESNRLYSDEGEYRGRIQGSTVRDKRDNWTGATIRTDNYYQTHKGYFREKYEDDLYPDE
jgi:sporulation protein YlmC with PRC-barrel domain